MFYPISDPKRLAITDTIGNRSLREPYRVRQLSPSMKEQACNASNAALDESTVPLMRFADVCRSSRQSASGCSFGPDMSVLGNTLSFESAAVGPECLNFPTGQLLKTIIPGQQSNTHNVASSRPFFRVAYLVRSWSV